MTVGGEGGSGAVVERLNAAMNAHDLEAFLACFHADYESEQPTHPDRAFQGRDQVRSNWSAIFNGVPDFRSQLLRSAVEGDTVWSEWHWQGTQSHGTPLDMVGVIVCGVSGGRISWARLYVEPVEQAGAGIESAVQRMSGDEQQRS
ncbi:MAG: nuclear transport factor 2 family protein [Solirubrobacteraceae bacterium]